MDKNKAFPLDQVPPSALTLHLTRSTIKMHHAPTWVVDKTLSVEDFVLCLEGRADYDLGGESLTLEKGQAMVIPRNMRFQGRNPTKSAFVGFAQHFTLSVFAEANLFSRLRLRSKVTFANWPMIESLGWHYRNTAPASSVTLAQHHSLMVLLLAYIDEAFLGWKDDKIYQPSAGGIDLAVSVAAGRIASEPLSKAVALRAVADAGYNPDYFQREFQKRIGVTPRQFQDFKRIERAMDLIASGVSVAEAGARTGYSDPYYFSRVFKKVTAMSPSEYRRRAEEARHGNLWYPEEDGLAAFLARRSKISR